MKAHATRQSEAANFTPDRRAAAPFGLRRSALAAGAALASINIWTGAPLLAVWVGSQAQKIIAGQGPGSGESMTAILVVVVVLLGLELWLVRALTRLSSAYDELTGRPPAARRTSPWLRSMRGEREELVRRRAGISTVERIVVVSVVAAVLSFEVWFFFFAGSSLPNA